MIKDKIKTLNALCRIVDQEKKSGKVIGFTNGCFDILHAGHVKYLEKAKAEGDILIVALNSDASVARIKARGRPVTGQKSRAAVLAALESVDYVLTFEETTPLKIIKNLKPDILIKGGDWKKEDIVGADFVKSYGGRVKSLTFLKGYSTTSIIKSILKKLKKFK
jgi:rfaE bifunctional protein nucleotidyltransferase chain/domain